MSRFKIVSIELKNGKLYVVFQSPSDRMLLCNPPRPAPDNVWRDEYAVVDGEIKLVDTVKGKYTPSYTVQEKIEFGDQ